MRFHANDQMVSKFKELPSLYVVLALLVETFLVFAQPPGQGLDEVRHFYRIWTFASGSWIDAHGRTGGPIPQCVSDYMNRFASASLGRGPSRFLSISRARAHAMPRPSSARTGRLHSMALQLICRPLSRSPSCGQSMRPSR